LRTFTEKDAPANALAGKKIVIAGYGNQGRPQALNLRDSGHEVIIAGRHRGKGLERARRDGFEAVPLDEGSSIADVFLMLLPDEVQGRVFREVIAERLRPATALCFAHGFSVAFGEIAPSGLDVILVAPKGQGERLREAYLEGSGLPCLLGVESDSSGTALQTALAVAHGLGCLRVGAFETSFREEAVSDLFGEQAVLCGGVVALVKQAFDVLTGHGFSPEVAYFECFHELKIIVDLFSKHGFAGMRDMISGTAAYGSLQYGESVITDDAIEELEKIFKRIDSGEFARDWLAKAGDDDKELGELRKRERELLIESVGDRVRKMFPKGKK
jgi:ketol-acid reductoisomerase